MPTPRAGGWQLAARTAQFVFVGTGLAFVLLHAAVLAAITWESLHAFAGLPYDGAMQTLDPLYRLADGQRPGRDFAVFHGVGMPLVHYPLFAILGADFFAAEVSRWFVALALGLGAPLAMLFALTRSIKKTAIGALVVAPFLQWPDLRLVQPGNSSLGVRSAAPLLVAAALYAIATSEGERWRRLRERRLFDLLTGVGGALAFLISTEHGVAAVLALILTWLATPARGERLRQRLVPTGALVGTMVLTIAVGMLAIAGSGWLDTLRYGLVTVPAEQFWYFGVPPNPMLTDWSAFVTDPKLWRIPLGFAALAVTFALRRRHAGAWPMFFLAGYGLLSATAVLGIYRTANMVVLSRSLFLIVLWLILVVGPESGRLRLTPRTVTVMVGVWFVFALPLGAPDARRELRTAKAALEQSREGEYAGLGLGELWTRHVRDLDRLIGAGEPGRPRVWSLYAGVWEHEHGTANPLGYDYLIHALGSDARRRYLEGFRDSQAGFVTTARKSQLGRFEWWLWNQHWDLYRGLLDRYEPAGRTPYELVWRRAPSTRLRAGPAREIRPPAVGQWARLGAPSPRRRLLELSVEYRTDNPWAGLPVAGPNPRYLVSTRQAVNDLPASLPPEETSLSFPLIVEPGDTPSIRSETHSLLPGVGLEISRLRLRELDIPAKSIQHLLEETRP